MATLVFFTAIWQFCQNCFKDLNYITEIILCLFCIDSVHLGQNGLPEPIMTNFFVYISYYLNAFSHAVNKFIPQIFKSSQSQLEALSILKIGDTITGWGGGRSITSIFSAPQY